jgi:hypothetical protein
MSRVERLSALFLKVENLAYRYLDRMFQKNTLNDLDILCDFDLLQFQTAFILQEVDKNYSQSIFICKLDIFQGKIKNWVITNSFLIWNINFWMNFLSFLKIYNEKLSRQKRLKIKKHLDQLIIAKIYVIRNGEA